MNADDQNAPGGEVDSAGSAGGGGRASEADGTGGRYRSRHAAGGSAGRRVRRGCADEAGNEPKKRGGFLRELPVLVIVALGLALLIKTFVVQAFWIPSGSMENTLLVGDRVLVNKLAYDFHDVHRGDVIVFNGAGSFSAPAPQTSPDNPFEAVKQAVAGAFGVQQPGEKDFIKRVVGIPGDHVACCDERGRVTVNGVPLNGEAYIYPGNVPSKMEFDITVPPGRLWVMGDHRAVSADSRAHLGDPGGGTIPIDKVVGRAFMTVWPPSHIELLSPPPTFEQPPLDQGMSSGALE